MQPIFHEPPMPHRDAVYVLVQVRDGKLKVDHNIAGADQRRIAEFLAQVSADIARDAPVATGNVLVLPPGAQRP